MTVLLAGCGAAAGALLRYAITLWGGRHLQSYFPFSTLFINLSGAFILGLLFALKLPVFVYALVALALIFAHYRHSYSQNTPFLIFGGLLADCLPHGLLVRYPAAGVSHNLAAFAVNHLVRVVFISLLACRKGWG